MIIFLLNVAAEVYVKHKYGVHKNDEATHAYIQYEHHLDVQPAEPEKAMHTSNEKRTETFTFEGEDTIAERSFRQYSSLVICLSGGCGDTAIVKNDT